MTFEEAIAQQPAWIGFWLNWLLIGAFILPLALLIWKESRVAGAVTVVASLAGGLSVNWLYSQMGYVKLLGLPHLIFWIPVAILLFRQIGRDDMRDWPKRIMAVVLVTILISLAFDVVDVARYVLGERTPSAVPAGFEG